MKNHRHAFFFEQWVKNAARNTIKIQIKFEFETRPLMFSLKSLATTTLNSKTLYNAYNRYSNWANLKKHLFYCTNAIFVIIQHLCMDQILMKIGPVKHGPSGKKFNGLWLKSLNIIKIRCIIILLLVIEHFFGCGFLEGDLNVNVAQIIGKHGKT